MSTLNDFELYVGDTGTEIGAIVKENGVVVDLSGATTKQIKFRKPSGAMVTKDAEFKTDGADGHLIYVTETGFLDESGTWVAQAYVVLATPWTGHSSSFELSVKALVS